MKRSLLIACGLLVAFVFYLFTRVKPHPPTRLPEIPATQPPAPPAPPALLPARTATPESPLSAWERLLAEDGSPSEDAAALQDILTNYLQSTSPATRAPLGPNEEFARALTDPESMGDSAIPPDHPALRDGQLIDRWGTPWFFHQESSAAVSIRSAGPDGKLFTQDDLSK